MGAKKIADSRTEAELIREVSRVISEITGVQLGERQHALVQGRLGKRMRDLKITDPLEYSRHYNANEAVEVGVLVSLMTTHHTFFFREFQHFEFLLKTTLPKIIKSHREKGLKTIRIWSAACSRGQEVYSLAMFLNHHLPELAPDMNFTILGSDVDADSVAIAKNGVYAWEELRSAPATYLQNNWTRGTGDIAAFVRARDSIRKGNEFKTINLIEIGKGTSGLPANAMFDVIFCRNVFIYFSPQQIKAIVSDFFKHLNPAGQLFIGLSETLNGLGLPIDWVGPSVYSIAGEKSAEKPAPQAASTGAPKVVPIESAKKMTESIAAKKLKVLCVDDSPTVLLLLKRILTSDKGFEIVGTAADGVEALEKAKTLKPDVMTLDIHMPRMTGVELLEKHGRELTGPGGAQVVVVSSVPRDDASLAYRCLECGAADYIEKPSAQNMAQVEEELIFKLRVAFDNGQRKKSAISEVDTSFKRSHALIDPKGKMRVVFASFGARESVKTLLSNFTGVQPPTVVVFEGAGDLYPDWVKKSATSFKGGRTEQVTSIKSLQPGQTVFIEFPQALEILKKDSSGLQISCLAVGPLNKKLVSAIQGASYGQLIIEDRGPDNPASLVPKAQWVVPLTSFNYESDRFLAGAQGSKK